MKDLKRTVFKKYFYLQNDMSLIFLVVSSYSYSTDSYKESYEHKLKLFLSGLLLH